MRWPRELLKVENSLPALVYARTRKDAESMAAYLQRKLNCKVGVYHAGLKPGERRDAQADFMSGRIQVIVGTIAFGMGIDKPNVRSVIHTASPLTLKVITRMGRGGGGRRDGPSVTSLVFSRFGPPSVYQSKEDEPKLQKIYTLCLWLLMSVYHLISY